MSRTSGVTGYVSPQDAGLHSEPRAVGRRIARLLDALADNVNSWIAAGPITADVSIFRDELIEHLRADGWIVSIDARDHYRVKPGPAYWAALKEQPVCAACGARQGKPHQEDAAVIVALATKSRGKGGNRLECQLCAEGFDQLEGK